MIVSLVIISFQDSSTRGRVSTPGGRTRNQNLRFVQKGEIDVLYVRMLKKKRTTSYFLGWRYDFQKEL